MPNEFSLRRSAVPVGQMNERQYAEWLRNQTTPQIKNGQAGYDTGTGFFLGDDNGVPKFSIGNSAGNKLTWDGTTLTVRGSLDLANIQTFTPTWSGFSSAPSGTLSYFDLGNFAILFTSAVRTGTGNAAQMQITNVPAAIQPIGGAGAGFCRIIDFDGSGGVNYPGVWAYGSGVLAFGTMQVLSAPGTVIDYFGTTAVGVKGLPAGWSIMYPT